MATLENFTVNLTTIVDMPSIEYINELAREKNFELNSSVKTVPPLLHDIYSIFLRERECEGVFDVKDFLFNQSKIASLLGRQLTESEEAYYKYSLKFLLDLDYTDCPGYSPMDKTLNTILYMTYLSDKQNKDQNPSPSVKTSVTDQSLCDMAKDLSNGAVPPGEESTKKNKQGADERKDVISCVRDYLYGLSPEIISIYGEEKTTMPLNKNIIRDLKVKATLEQKLKLGTSIDIKKELNNDSNVKESKQMNDYSQVTKVSKTSMMMPDFKQRLAKKELTVKLKVKPIAKKQSLFMLLDDSGSMNSEPKQMHVRAVLLNRLESVIAGKSELRFSLFESQRYGFKLVKTLDEAKALFKDISARRPSGGGTHIGRVLQETINELVKDKTLHGHEIMIVNDGDDFVNPEEIDFKGVKIHVVILGTDNPNLKKIAEASGGFYNKEHMYDRY